MSTPSAAELFEALGIASEHCGPLQFALQVIASVPKEQFTKAIHTIDRAETWGPFTDPSFFVNTPNAFDNGRKNKALFEALAKLKDQLPELDWLRNE